MSLEDKNKSTTTATDTLAKKSRDEGIISGGHLVAKALKAEGVDTIFTLCGGHIIDIYDVVDLILFLGDDLGNVSVYNVVNNLS